MSHNRHLRGWALIAIVAIGIALLLLLVPHVHSGDSAAWLAILPILFVGIISPLSLLSPMAFMYLGRTPDAPILPAPFERPPPIRLA